MVFLTAELPQSRLTTLRREAAAATLTASLRPSFRSRLAHRLQTLALRLEPSLGALPRTAGSRAEAFNRTL